ncbi:MAG: PAS domain S-box protein [Nitrospirae bacterium]|nr:PAS domain S-box protein [Nitrospirota bacterium]
MNSILESLELFKAIFENSNDGKVIFDPVDERFLLSNLQFQKMLGYSNDEIKMLSVRDLHPKEDWKWISTKFNKAVDERISLSENIPLLRKDGSVLYADINSYHIVIEKLVLVGVFRDITRRKQLQDNLNKSLKFTQNIIDCSMDMIITADKYGRIDTFNNAAQQVYGYSEEEILGKDINILRDGHQSEINVLNVVKETGSFSGNVIRRRKDGSTFHCALSVAAFLDKSGNFNGGVSTARDITEQVLLQNNLRKSLQFIHNIIDSSMDMIIATDHYGRIIEFNKSAQDTYGYSLEEIIGENVNILSGGKSLLDLVIKKGSFRGEVTRIRKDGSTFPCALSASLMLDENSNIIGTVGISRDVSEQTQLQENLNKLVQYIKGIIDSSMDMIIATDKDGRIAEFNLAAQEKFHYHMDEIIGRSLAVIFSRLENVEDIFYETIRRGKYKAEVLNVCKDGKEFSSSISCAAMLDVNGEDSGIVMIIRDITERKLLEKEQLLLINSLTQSNIRLKESQEQLVQAEKMASLGQLVAGVAHEINTPIGIALTTASSLVTLTNNLQTTIDNKNMKKSEFEQYLKDCVQGNDLILRNLNRTAELIRSFKMVSADQTSQEVRKFNLKLYIDDIIISLRPKLKRTQHFIDLSCIDDIELESNPGAFAQIITNIVMNSLIHGFDEGDNGQIVISCKQVVDVIVLKYSDNGKGIPSEHINKIFDPFFTTKRGAGGTGLGLNIVYNIVNKALKGTIRCESSPGLGTTFIMELPINLNKEITARPYKPKELRDQA